MRRLIASYLAILMFCGTGVHADSVADSRRAIQSDYDKMNAAAERRDDVGTLAYRTPDAVVVMGRSVTTVAQERVNIKQLFASAQSITAQSLVKSLSLNGAATATAMVREHMAMVMASPGSPQKVIFVINDTSRDLWIKTTQGWRQKRSEDVSHSMTINGKPISNFSERTAPVNT